MALLGKLLLLSSLAAPSAEIESRLQSWDLLLSQTYASNFDYTGFQAMTTLLENPNGWHAGERAVHALLKVPTSERQNPTAAGLPLPYANRVTTSPLVAIGTLDDEGRPWTSIWGGERGFARTVAQGILGVQSLVDKINDPVVQALMGRAVEGELVKPEDGKVMSALSIDPERRDRVKLAGKMVVGTVTERPDNNTTGEAQLAMHVQESMGNCPKYLNKKTIRAHVPSPQHVSSSLPLPPEALALIQQADMFFLSSTNGQTMDTNHRGGSAGFVRVVSNSADGVTLIYPEYSGNRLYQTLGNLHINPLVGIAIPDYTTSDILYLTGSSQLLIGPAAASVLPHTNLAVKITVHAARFIRDGLPFRGTPGEPSPYNPPVRRLATETPPLPSAPPATASPIGTLTLTRRDLLTPSIARLTFLFRPSREDGQRPLVVGRQWWRPGQHVTLSFAAELDQGYSHMRDSDPQSLNDDFVRTFTISSPPPLSLIMPSERKNKPEEKEEKEVQLELTVRRRGAATGLLFTHHLGPTHPPLEIEVLAVGGGEEEERFLIPLVGDGKGGASLLAGGTGTEGEKDSGRKAVFVAGGIGITPLLAQAPSVLAASSSASEAALEVLWSLRGEDLPLAVDSFERIPGLGDVTKVFVTGDVKGVDDTVLGRLQALGARVDVRGMRREDVLGAKDGLKGTKYFACASPGMLKSILIWLEDEDVAFENFEY
ncbi:hypothetical protein VTI28DRAFT_9770 [Corynascus sepedonium]